MLEHVRRSATVETGWMGSAFRLTGHEPTIVGVGPFGVCGNRSSTKRGIPSIRKLALAPVRDGYQSTASTGDGLQQPMGTG